METLDRPVSALGGCDQETLGNKKEINRGREARTGGSVCLGSTVMVDTEATFGDGGVGAGEEAAACTLRGGAMRVGTLCGQHVPFDCARTR